MIMDIREGAFVILALRSIMLIAVAHFMFEWCMVMMIEMGQLEAVDMRHAYYLTRRECEHREYSHKPSQRGR